MAAASSPSDELMTDWNLSKTFASPQGKISWDAFGDGPPIVLLHGTPNWSFIWRKVVRRLSRFSGPRL
jgi:pimeloyl-ACP methyl ester carboxylesterase